MDGIVQTKESIFQMVARYYILYVEATHYK